MITQYSENKFIMRNILDITYKLKKNKIIKDRRKIYLPFFNFRLWNVNAFIR